MFGTFEQEKDDENIVYGLVDQPQYFNPIKHQFHYFHKVYQKAASMSTWKEAIYAFIKGPGWFPGTPRLGDPMGVPEIQIREKYDPKAPQWINIYVLIHFAISVIAVEHMGKMSGMYQLPVFGIGLYLIWSISSLGLLFDNSIYGWINELLRSVVCLVVYHTFGGWKGFIVPRVLINVLYGVSVTISSLCIVAYLRQSERKNDVSSEVGGIQKKEAKKIK
jgi:alkylglycerol monooxygenase